MKLVSILFLALITISIIFYPNLASAVESLDFENCQGFLSVAEVTSMIEFDGELEMIIKNTGFEKSENPNIKNLCDLTFQKSGSYGEISMTLMEFNESPAALKQYETFLEGIKTDEVQINEGENPWKFISFEINQGGVSAKIFAAQRDVYYLAIFSSQVDTSESFASLKAIEDLSSLVQQKIFPSSNQGSSSPNSRSDDDKRTNSDDTTSNPSIGEGLAQICSEDQTLSICEGFIPPNPSTEEELANSDDVPTKSSPSTLIIKEMLPREQLADGILPHQIICNEGLELIFKKTNGLPNCVKFATAGKLIDRGWGTYTLQ